MRLIDADEFKEIIVTYGKAGFAALRINKICELIDSQTTAYDMDKVVEQLEELNKVEKSFVAEYDEDGRLDLMDIHDAKAEAYRSSRRIVKSGGIE